MICKRCRGGKCELSEDNYAEFECPNCDSYGCEECENTGTFQLTKCAHEYTRDLIRPMNMAALAEKGFLPYPGGLMAQSAWFIDFWITVQNEQNRIESEARERR